MSEYIEPPIGVSPHWYVYNKRIEELSNAITRYTDFIMRYNNIQDGRDYYKAITEWANEIKMLAEIETQLLSTGKREYEKNERTAD